MEIKLIYGSPGTGKTTHLLTILENVLEHYNKNEVAYVSYTKQGAEQGVTRSVHKFGGKRDDYTYFRTLHSLIFKELNLRRSDVIQKDHYREFSKKMGMNFTGYYTEDFSHSDDKYLFFQDLHKNNPKLLNKYLYNMDLPTYKFVKRNFNTFKEYYNLVDFTDMVMKFIEVNKPVPVKIAIIDEAQDLTTLQWQAVWVAFANCETIYIAGDDDQAIYEWSGADVDYFLDIKGDVTVLNQSYRLPKLILDFSKTITALITKRATKHYNPVQENGEIERIVNLNELKITANTSWLFLSRNNFFLKEIEAFLQSKGLPYKLKGVPKLKQSEIDLIRLYEHIRTLDNRDGVNMVGLFPHLKKDYSFEHEWYNSFNWDIDKTTHYRDYFANKIYLEHYDINVSTIHSVKGAEADNVVVLQDITRNVYMNLEHNPDSEHRVFYVAVTRAKHKLYIVSPKTKYYYDLKDNT